MKLDKDIIKNIYEHMGDEESKSLFADRLLFSLTNDIEFMFNIIRKTPEGMEIEKRLSCSQKNIAIFGAGIWGKNILKLYCKFNIVAFVDNNVNDCCVENIPVYTLEELKSRYSDVLIIISSRLYYAEMHKQLLDSGIFEEDIINAGKLIDDMSKRQYFDLPYLQREDEEVFVDGGSLDGLTSLQFIHWAEKNYKKIYVFEPDIQNIAKCVENLKSEEQGKIEIIEKGLWDKDDILRFEALANRCSKISEQGVVSIKVASLDEVVNDKVSFVKMDIEGAEYKALLGSSNIIKQYKPKLAISIYHKPEDIVELPKLLLELNPDYQFYLRHYSLATSETVLYAV